MRALVVATACLALLGCAAAEKGVAVGPPRPPRLDRDGEAWARRTLGRLSARGEGTTR